MGGNFSSAKGINNAGTVVGYSSGVGDASWRATVWTGGVGSTLGTLGGGASEATSINNSGVVAGHAYISGNRAQHATTWSGGTITDLGTLGGTSSYATGINDSGIVVGYSDTVGDANRHAVMWSGGVMTDLGVPSGADYSFAQAINNSGVVVGFSFQAGGYNRATLWNAGVATDLNSFLDASAVNAGWYLIEAYDINDSGAVVGVASNSLTGQSRPFMLAPVPEPETYAMLLAGLALVGAMTRRRARTFVALVA
jgi:probable HAF family extracellular repeat protein